MSIALSAVIHPSRLVRVAQLAFGAACAGAAAMLGWQGARFHLAPLLASACGAAALLAWRSAATAPKARQIDISGLGEIRVSVQQNLAGAASHGAGVTLLAGSTIWPSLLLLLLREARPGPTMALLILPDSMPDGQFRKLAVSVRSIAGRDNKFSKNNEIL